MSDARTITRLRFPPWQVCELQGGYAVEDAEGRRLGTFYGKSDPVEARQTGLLTLEEARQTAFDFARLAELLDLSLERALDAAGPRKKVQPRLSRRRRASVAPRLLAAPHRRNDAD